MTPDNITATQKPRVVISGCLFGQNVRYDGGHKKDDQLIEWLSTLCELVPLCPEVAIGLGVPRPPIQLTGEPGHPEATGVDNPSTNVTNALKEYAGSISHELKDISGIVFKSRSPSCGLRDVPVIQNHEPLVSSGTGIFAAALTHLFPLVPAATEAALRNIDAREHFMEQIARYTPNQHLTQK